MNQAKSQNKIAFVASSYTFKHDGISIYLENILYELLKEDCVEIDLYIRKSLKQKLSERLPLKKENLNFNVIHIPENFVCMVFFINFVLNLKKYKLIFSPCLTPLISLRNKSLKVIHDVTYKVYPHSLNWKKKLYKSILFKLTSFDNFIGYISKSTLDQINLFLKIRRSQELLLMSNGIPFSAKLHFREEEIQFKNIKNEKINILFVGSQNYHKGLDKAILLTNHISNYLNTEITLNIVGKETNETAEILREIEASRYNIKTFGYVNDQELYNLYKKSDFVAIMSQSEGFGIPLVESCLFGCIPILNNLPSFKEIIGENYPMFDSGNMSIEDFTKLFVEFILTHKNIKNDLRFVVDKYWSEYSNSAKKLCIQLQSQND